MNLTSILWRGPTFLCLLVWYFFTCLLTKTTPLRLLFNLFKDGRINRSPMGLLSHGEPLSWDETEKYAEQVRRHGINQFVNLYNRLKDHEDNCFQWGDEIEYMIVKFDHKNKKVRLSLKAEKLLSIINEMELEKDEYRANWRPEFSSYMIEASPSSPYGAAKSSSFKDIDTVEAMAHTVLTPLYNMKHRRKRLETLLDEDESLLCVTSFPRLGCDDFTWPVYKPDPANSISGSLFYPDEAVFNGHPRFRTLVKNIRSRRKRKVIINIPIFRDIKTPDPFFESFDDEEAKRAMKIDHIYMDAMGFGMGCCCLQVTFQAANLLEARSLYDGLIPLCPILLALSAASPIYRGLISDLDCRWKIISQSVDDRTKEELGEEPLRKKYRIVKSRFDTVDCYISKDGEKYNDLLVTYSEQYYQQMVDNGVDPLIAKHIAHLFIRDPIALYKEKLNQDDKTETDHFENLQSTNWQTMRFKPPPPDQPNIGWRVEFRPVEVQITEFENAAFVVFIVLLTRAILTYRLNLLIPISKVDENMQEAQKRDALRRCRFWFRKDIVRHVSPLETQMCVGSTRVADDLSHACEVDKGTSLLKGAGGSGMIDDSCVLMTVDEIINGRASDFPGLVPLVRQYLLCVEMDAQTYCMVNQYLNLIADKASGKCLTTAQWIRNFARSHPDYEFNSKISDEINYDLLVTIDKITKGEIVCEELIGKDRIINGCSSKLAT